MIGTLHEGNALWFHDALPQMAASCTVTWMREQGYLKGWILPEKDLNVGTVFARRPVGNFPELMCWKSSLNKDLKDQLERHVAFTASLDKDCDFKFSKATPKEIDRALERLVDPSLGASMGVPSSRRIIQDVTVFRSEPTCDH